MSLRYRLFLWITVCFLAAGAVDYLLDNFTTDKKIADAQELLKKKIIEVSEEKRQRYESFLASSIADQQSYLDFTLTQLTNFFLQAAHFAPIQVNEKQGTWADAADVLVRNQGIDLIQNTIDGKLVSCIAPRPASLDLSYTIPIDDNMAWVMMGDELDAKMPLIGVRVAIDYAPGYTQPEGEQISLRKGALPEGYLLFSIEDLLKPTVASVQAPIFQKEILTAQGKVPLPWSEGFNLVLNGFYQSFAKARDYLQQGLGHLSSIQSSDIRAWVEKELRSKGKSLDTIQVYPPGYSKISSQFIEQRLNEITKAYHQIDMIWVIASFFDTGVFGNNLFQPPSPRGISVNRFGEAEGGGLHTKDDFFPIAFFNDARYYQNHHDPNSLSNLGTSIAVFRGPEHHVYLGNTAQLLAVDQGKEKTGYLTLAIDGDHILQRLVETVSQTAFLIYNNEVFGALSDKGERINLSAQDSVALSGIVKGTTGFITWNNVNYFYSRMTPFSEVDLHFLILNPVAVEFAFTKYVVNGAIEVIQSVLFNVHFIGFSTMVFVLLLLHRISLRITRPITLLALATKQIGEGHLDNVNIPHPKNKDSGDEVATLCTAFEQMVVGIKEKEKVKAVLNKVVSQEIAQEILKGNIHLGGEEKKVTVMFADIRNFTHMTQNMKPQDVVDLLNSCMTRVSNIIDDNGGVIDKYVGDSTMALFGAPVPYLNSAMQAISSALKIVEEIKQWNVERTSRGAHPIEMGIGIHTGMVLAGNMGAENRLNYTVIGRNVNLASRLCGSAQGMEIRISKETWNEPSVQDQTIAESLGPTLLKGFDDPIEVFRVIGRKT